MGVYFSKKKNKVKRTLVAQAPVAVDTNRRPERFVDTRRTPERNDSITSELKRTPRGDRENVLKAEDNSRSRNPSAHSLRSSRIVESRTNFLPSDFQAPRHLTPRSNSEAPAHAFQADDEDAQDNDGIDDGYYEEEERRLYERKPPQVPPQSSKKALRWQKGELLGSGAYGKVYLGLNLDTGELIAVKQVVFAGMKGKVEEHVTALQCEIEVLQNLEHDNIVRYLGTETDVEQQELRIFLEYVPGGSIASLISKFGHFGESVIRVYTRQLLLGLEYLHSHQIMHRDIKGANILVDNNGTIKLADFGASKRLEEMMTITDGHKSLRGTPYWMAPEVIKQTGHGRQADIWSVACTVLEMATGKPPWSQFQSQVSALFHIASAKGPPPLPDSLSPEGHEFLLQCFKRNPKDRPNATRLLQHPFVNLTGSPSRFALPSPPVPSGGAAKRTLPPPTHTIPEEETDPGSATNRSDSGALSHLDSGASGRSSSSRSRPDSGGSRTNGLFPPLGTTTSGSNRPRSAGSTRITDDMLSPEPRKHTRMLEPIPAAKKPVGKLPKLDMELERERERDRPATATSTSTRDRDRELDNTRDRPLDRDRDRASDGPRDRRASTGRSSSTVYRSHASQELSPTARGAASPHNFDSYYNPIEEPSWDRARYASPDSMHGWRHQSPPPYSGAAPSTAGFLSVAAQMFHPGTPDPSNLDPYSLDDEPNDHHILSFLQRKSLRGGEMRENLERTPSSTSTLRGYHVGAVRRSHVSMSASAMNLHDELGAAEMDLEDRRRHDDDIKRKQWQLELEEDLQRERERRRAMHAEDADGSKGGRQDMDTMQRSVTDSTSLRRSYFSDAFRSHVSSTEHMPRQHNPPPPQHTNKPQVVAAPRLSPPLAVASSSADMRGASDMLGGGSGREGSKRGGLGSPQTGSEALFRRTDAHSPAPSPERTRSKSGWMPERFTRKWSAGARS